MSEEMQTKSSSKDQKSTKFAEGRLKLSTSCTECHRRKQKCDQKQPCRHCSRRFPQPECVYKSLKDLGLPGNELSGKEQDILSQKPLSENKATKRNHKHPVVSSNSHKDKTVPRTLQDVKPMVGSSISPNSFDQFSPLAYQSIVGLMITNLEEKDVPPTDHVAQYNFEDQPTAEGLTPLPIIRRGSQSFGVVGPPSRFSISSVDPLHFLGITPTHQSSELLHGFVKVIARYVVSLDGNVKPNYYNGQYLEERRLSFPPPSGSEPYFRNTWVPWTMKSPLLAQFAIFVASCYQSETQRIPPQQSAIVLGHKLKSIGMLNELLRSKDKCLSVEAMTAVNYLCTNEWYWSNFENVQAHLKGLKEIVRLKGGLGELSDDNRSVFQRVMIILLDYQLSSSYEVELTFPHNISTFVSYPASMSCPLLYSLVNFSSIQDQIGIVPEAAKILDQIRLVFMAVMRLVESTQSPEETDKVLQFTRRIQDKIISSPDAIDAAAYLGKDFIYKSCRCAALIYCKAVIERTPMSKACTLLDLNQLWACMWRVTLTDWKRIPGIFMWVILAGNPAAQGTPHGRFQKSMLKASSSYIAVDHFDVVDASFMTYIKLQRWLRSEKKDSTVVESLAGMRDLPYLHRYPK